MEKFVHHTLKANDIKFKTFKDYNFELEEIKFGRIKEYYKNCQFLNSNKRGENLIFMNNETFEQINISIDMIGDQSAFLQDGMNVIINIYNDEPVSVIMPDNCVEEIIEADAVIKGQTVSSSFKPAILKNGVKVKNAETISTSFPNFYEIMKSLGAKLKDKE